MILKVLYYPHSLLKYPTKPVIQWNDDLKDFVLAMKNTMKAFEGIGLAANQVGVSRRILLIEYIGLEESDRLETTEKDNPTLLTLINPEVIELRDEFIFDGDACLSFPGLSFPTQRYHSCTVEYFNLEGQRHTVKAQGLAAVELQHEIDHLNGRIFLERTVHPVDIKEIPYRIKNYLKTHPIKIKERLETWPKSRLTF